MSLSSNQSIVRGRFTSNGSSQFITLPWLPHKIELLNISQFGSSAATTPVITAEWRQGMSDASVITGTKTNGAATIAIPAMNTTNGITLVDLSDQTPGAPITGTAVTRGATTTITAASHGLSVNDNIIVYNTTGMLQIAGYHFTVISVGGVNDFDIGLDSSGFAADGTAVTIRKINPPLFYPESFFVGSITQASQAVVTITQRIVSPTVDIFTEGQIVKLVVPAAYGMTEMDGMQAQVVSVSGPAATLDVDSSAFTAFSFPTSATAAAGVTPAQLIPVGKVGAPVVYTDPASPIDVVTNQAIYGVSLGTNAIGGNTDIMEWVAYRALSI